MSTWRCEPKVSLTQGSKNGSATLYSKVINVYEVLITMTDEEILAIAEKYGTSETRERLLFCLEWGEPTGETYPQTDWHIGQEDLLAFARELLEKTKAPKNGLDQLIERIRFLEQQIEERKNQ